MRILGLFAFALALLAGGVLSIFNVPEGSQARVMRGSEVHRTVGPGLQARIPLVERVEIEPVPPKQ